MTRDPYAVCLDIVRAHHENFPVASHLVPARMRRHIAAVYAFARIADDFADEGHLAPDYRHRLLDDWEHRLRVAAAGSAERDGSDEAAVFAALEQTIAACSLPISLFTDLLSAFRQDVDVTRYATWPDLLDYCRRSANPVGRLVLRISGRDDAALDASSDALCTALQLTNFWQDLERDWKKGRVYLPADLMAAHGADEGDIAAGVMTPPLREALADAAERTRNLFHWGRHVCSQVGGRLGVELRATWLGGTRILDRLARSHFDVFQARPSLGARDALPITAQLVWWSARASQR
ncbi:MAG TPA: squalene synthase HpnC [Vicinamibacterales bacterium]|nr:squalene synthase HpnC [Vicinamibacterales bacterium]